MAMLEINDLTREFTRRGARFAAVDHVSFSMDQANWSPSSDVPATAKARCSI